MPIATPEQYAEMLGAARKNGYAYPAVNVTSSSIFNAAIRGFAEAGSDGIVQMTTGGAKVASGSIADAAARARALAVIEALGHSDGRYMLAATFGNVHGVYADVNTKLRPEVLGELKDAVVERHGEAAAFNFVFHGGSGSTQAQIAEALRHGVVKMNVDTDMQYAYTRGAADHVFRNYGEVLKVDGGVGDKKAYDPRAWMKQAEASMAARVVEACEQLGSTGKSLQAAVTTQAS